MSMIPTAALPLTIRPDIPGARPQLAAPEGPLVPFGEGPGIRGRESASGPSAGGFADALRAQAGGADALSSADALSDSDTASIKAVLANPQGPLTPLGSTVASGPGVATASLGNAPVAAATDKSYLLGSRAGAHAPDVKGGENFFGADGFTFGDFIDIINPLQHIPVLSNLYRSLTGDEISPGARVLGGGLFGGGIGLFASATSTAASATVKAGAVKETQVASLSAQEKEAQIASLRTSSNPNRFRQIAALQSYQQNMMIADAAAGEAKTLAKV